MEIEIINLNEFEPVASPKKPLALLIWPDMTPKEIDGLKNKIKASLEIFDTVIETWTKLEAKKETVGLTMSEISVFVFCRNLLKQINLWN